jgi:hypothetical protein
MRMALPGRMAEGTAEARPAFQPVLGEGRVRLQGEPVVAIAAETPEAAALAAERVRVEYEELTGVYDPREALAPGAPEVHAGGNLLHRWRLRRGDVDAGFRRADVTVEHTYHTPFIDHAYMETETGVGLDRRRGRRRAAGEHPGAGALPRRGGHAGSSAQPRPDRGRVPGRGLRRQGRRHRRVPARPPWGGVENDREAALCLLRSGSIIGPRP